MKTYLLFLFLFITEFCFAQGKTIGGVINNYSPVIDFNKCDNKITVEDASTFNQGDTVLMIQMKGAVIDTSNTANFGTVIGYKNAGNYEFNYVKSKSGNVVVLKNNLTRQYDIPAGKVQLVRVPYYNSVTVTSALTCLPWDGNKGGILAFNVKDTLTMQNDINVSGKGYKGGVMHNSMINTFSCGHTEYYYPINTIFAAGKGESIADLDSTKNAGRGLKASGGGGGLDPNTGGGGGGNGNVGGQGGFGYGLCVTTNSFGLAGKPLNYNTVSNKIFMAGGGGAGHCNNGFSDPTVNTDFNGGNGGGLVIISSNYLAGNNKNIIANGDTAYELTAPGYLAHDGMGGGGAGGTVLINNNNYISNLNVKVFGGKGGNMSSSPTGGLVGPGGGGAGGVVWLNQNSLPANVIITNSGGNGGVILQNGNNPYGATDGTQGINVFNLKIPIDTVPFKKNIDSVRIKDSVTSCSVYNFKGLGYTNTSMIVTWQWDFGDGTTANTQNTSHNYSVAGNYTVKLFVTDVNGCKDSVIKNISGSTLSITKSNDTTVCKNTSVQLFANGGTTYSWTPATYLNNPNVSNPVSSPQGSITYHVTVTNAFGCSNTDSIKLFIKSQPVFSISPDQNVCASDPKQLVASGGNYYLWQPSTFLNDPNISNPVSMPATTTTYSVKIKDNTCNDSTVLTTILTVLPLPSIKASKTNDIDCTNNFTQLNATGGRQYLWQPAKDLDDSTSTNPIAKPLATTLFIVKGYDNNGCKNTDTVTVNVGFNNSSGYYMPTGFSPNGDGINDCFGLKYWGNVTELDFSIYNRWGERVFYSTNAANCWDGKYKGQLQETASFVYIIKAKTTCGSVTKKGTVFLVR